MFTTCRNWYKYGNEDDIVECTFKDHDTIEKAITYTHRYAKGIKFVSCTIEDETGKVVYELLADGQVYDNRK